MILPTEAVWNIMGARKCLRFQACSLVCSRDPSGRSRFQPPSKTAGESSYHQRSLLLTFHDNIPFDSSFFQGSTFWEPNLRRPWTYRTFCETCSNLENGNMPILHDRVDYLATYWATGPRVVFQRLPAALKQNYPPFDSKPTTALWLRMRFLCAHKYLPAPFTLRKIGVDSYTFVIYNTPQNFSSMYSLLKLNKRYQL